jgi:hypothetical protein
MLITPAPGANRGNVLKSLRTVAMEAGNLQGAHYSDAYGRLLGYLAWANSSVRLLRNQVAARDIDQLVLTRGHAALLAGAGNLAGHHQQGLVNSLVDLEVTERIAALSEAVTAVENLLLKWPDDDSTAYLVPDSSFYIQHPDKLEDTDFTALLDLRTDRRVHLLIPAVVIDELDALKESKGRSRWRSGYTLAVLDRILNSEGIGILQAPSGGFATGDYFSGVSAEILFEQPGHVRLPLPDDEIVDRCVGANVLTGGQGVTLLTYDTGQSTRARLQKLRVCKFRHEAGTGDEPDWAAEEAARRGNGSRGRRKDQQEKLETRQSDDDA